MVKEAKVQAKMRCYTSLLEFLMDKIGEHSTSTVLSTIVNPQVKRIDVKSILFIMEKHGVYEQAA